MKLHSALLTLALALCTPALAANAASDGLAPEKVEFTSLNTRVVVDDGVIRLGDIFQGAGKYANRVVAYAPRPGGSSVFDARWLKRIASAFKLNWTPGSAADRALVERSSQIITKEEVEDLLHQRLVDEGGDSESRVNLANRSMTLHLPTGQDYLLGIEQISFDPNSGRFTAILAWGSGNDDRRRVAGRLERLVEVPVLSQRFMKGDVIHKDDLEWVEVAENRLQRNAVIDASRLIGMATKRPISQGKPLSLNDVRQPQLVDKGELVTMELTTPVMRLTAKGKALESGGKGDTIRISNTQTSTVVEGIITAAGTVRIDVPVNLAMR